MLSRRLKIFFAFIAVVAGGYIMSSRFGFTANGVPAEFKEARLQGAIIAQDIVNLSNGLASALERVNQLDKEHNYTEALAASAELLKQSQEVRTKALELSAQLEKMTGALTTIKDPDARKAALESISHRLAIIGRLLSYSDYLSQLLRELGNRFNGIANIEVKTLINQINAEVTAINNFNSQAGQAMDRFDQILKGE